MRSKLVACLVMLCLLPTAALAAAQVEKKDPVGDVDGPLDLKKVTVDWTDKAVATNMVMVADSPSALLEFSSDSSGALWFNLFTARQPEGDYHYRYSVAMYAYNGELFGSLHVSTTDDPEMTYIADVKVTRPDAKTFRVKVPRKYISGDKSGKKFAFWYQATYTGGECSDVCDDLAPNGDKIFVSTW